ncbi:MAG: YkgJ family cysteine cluster protein [Bacteroidota bacterium]
MIPIQTDLSAIAETAVDNEAENDSFREFLKGQDGDSIDKIVHELNENISAKIDCTQCGNCCKSLMINITGEEINGLAAHLQTTPVDVKQKYVEESPGGKMIINTIPCHFLDKTVCTIYEHRFTECREFPHLHRPGFVNRLFGTLMYYSMCPIIFNVVEALKMETGFKK